MDGFDRASSVGPIYTEKIKHNSSLDQIAVELGIEEKIIRKLFVFLRDMQWIEE